MKRLRTEKAFTSAVEKQGDLLVLFYAPWCEHCNALMGPFKETADRLEEANVPVTLAKVDATKQTELAEKNGVKGYPTLR